jgi:hypothetical protein
MDDSEFQTSKDIDECSSVSDTGLPCQKKLYHAQNGEYWDHAGGHIYALPETMEKFRTLHYDAGAALSGQPVSFHFPEECTYEGYCAWRRNDRH